MTEEEVFQYMTAVGQHDPALNPYEHCALQMGVTIVRFIEDIQAQTGKTPDRTWLDEQFKKAGVQVDKTLTVEIFGERLCTKKQGEKWKQNYKS